MNADGLVTHGGYTGIDLIYRPIPPIPTFGLPALAWLYACSVRWRQRELGTPLRQLRNKHGLTVKEVAKYLEFPTAKMSCIEIGVHRGPDAGHAPSTAAGDPLQDVRR